MEKKWTTCKLTQAREKVTLLKPMLDRNILSTSGKTGTLIDLTQPDEDDDSKESRMCVSPESGIDCDEMNSPEQMNEFSVKHEPISKPQANIPAQLVITEDQIYSDASNAEKNNVNEFTNQIRTRNNFAAEENLIKDEDVGINRYTTPCVGDDDDELTVQIVSVHSLATSANSANYSASKQSEKDCEEIRKKAQYESQWSVFSDPLPKCSRLYIRRIKGLNTGIKSVLVMEAEYSQAAPLPAHILNKRRKTSSCTSANANSKYCYVKSSGRKLKREISAKLGSVALSRKKGILRNTNTYPIVRQCAPRDDTNLKNSPGVVETNGQQKGECEDWESFDQMKQVHAINTVVTNSKKAFKTDINKDKRVGFFHDPTNIDRISQLKEKLKQKEADLERIRKNVVSWKQINV